MQPIALRLFSTKSIARDIGLVMMGVALLALSAQVVIPFYPVPFTLQTMGIMVIGLSLGAFRGGLAALLYVALGAIGLPIFASGDAGMVHILGATGGYLIACPIACALLGWASEKGWDRTFSKAAAAVIAGEVIIFALGVGVLSGFVGLRQAFMEGFVVFIPAEILKGALTSVAMPGIWKLIGRSGDEARS